MNREVEERIVAMYFDNQDFEKNAKTTIDTLGQLKEGLNLEKSAKGFDVFEKIGKNLNFEKMNQGLTKVRNGLSSMNGALGKVFKIGEAPVREAENMVNTIRGYISKVVGIDIASSLVHSVTSAFQGLVIQPISKGWNQYESEMDSVKTIMSSTGESLTVVEDHLKSMTEYANKTIYSLTDMTSNLGKFTNNGVKLDQSVKAMEGIANATADAGQGAQQASMAMYNISQAIGVGKMTTIDWKSLENANIATTKLKKTFLEMAALHGKIEKKTNKDGSISYMLTKDENGKKLKQSIELTTANFREYLSKGWLDKETMLRTFEIYSGSVKESTLESWGIHDKDQKKYFMELGQQALNSATQVRTFTKMMDALKESVQSGWSESFKWIFGDMEQGTELWTRLNDELDKVLSKSSENRNKILEVWAGRNTNIESETKALEQRQEALAEAEKKLKTLKDKKEIEKQKKLIEDYHKEIKSLKKTISDKKNLPKSTIVDKQGRSGRDIAIDSLFSSIKIFKRLGSMVSGAFESVFGKLNAQGLFDFTQKIEKAIKRISKWFGTLKQPESRLSKIQKALKGVLNIVKMLINFGGKLFNLAKKIAGPVIDFLIDGAANIFGFFDGLADKSPSEILEEVGKGLKSAWDEIKRWFTPQDITDDQGKVIGKEMPIVTWLKQGWEDLKKIVKDWIYESGFGEIYESVASWWDEFKKGVDDAYAGLQEWWNGTGIPGFFKNIWDKITEWFTPKKTIKPILTESGSYVLTAEEEDMPIVAFFKNLGTTIDDAFKEVEKWWNGSGIPGFFTRMWNAVTGIFKPKLDWVEYDGKKGRVEHYADSPIVAFFKSIIENVGGAFKDVQNWWNNESGIPAFFKRMWKQITKWFEPTFTGADYDGKKGRIAHYDDSPIVAFFKGIWKGIEDAYTGLKNWWEHDSGIPQFFKRMWKQVTKWFQPTLTGVTYDGKKGRIEHYADSPIVGFFKGTWEGLKSIFGGLKKWYEEDSGIPTFFTNLWNDVSGWFTNEKEGEKSGFEKFLEDIGKGISDAWNFITNEIPWEKIGEFFTNIYDFIAKLISGEEQASDSAGNTAQLKDVSQRHGGMIAAMTGVVSDISVHTKQLTDATDKAADESPSGTKTKTVLEFFTGILTAVGDFFARVAAAVNGIVIPEGISTFITNMLTFLQGIMKVVGDILGSFGNIALGKGTLMDALNVGIPLLIAGVVQIFDLLRAKYLSGIESGSSIGQSFMQLCIGILAVSVAIALLSSIDQDKMWPAVGAIAAIGAVLSAVFIALSALKVANGANAPEPVTSSERILTNLINTVGKIGMIAVALSLLPNIIETIGKVKKDLGKDGGGLGEDIMYILLGLSGLIATVGLTFSIIEKIAPKGIDPVSAGKTAIAIAEVFSIMTVIGGLIITGIGALVGLANSEEGENGVINALKDGIKFFEELFQGVGGILLSFARGLVGWKSDSDKAEESLGIMSKIGDALEQFSDEKIGGISRVLNLMMRIVDYKDKLDPSAFSNFASYMAELGQGILSFHTIIEGTDEIEGIGEEGSEMYKKYEGAIGIIQKLSEALAPAKGLDASNLRAMRQFISSFGDDKDGQELLANFVVGLRNLLRAIGTDGDISGINFDNISLITKLFEGIQNGLMEPPDFDATAIIESILKALKVGDMAIAEVIHTMVQKGIKLSGEENGGGKYTTTKEEETTSKIVEKLLEGGTTAPTLDTSALEAQVAQLTGENGLITQLTKSLPSFGEVMDSKGWTSFTDADGKPVDIVGGLQEKLTDLSTTLNETPLQVTITPVFDMKNLTAEGVQKALSENHVPLFFNTEGMRVDFSGLNQALDMDGIKSRLDVIAGNILLSRNDQVSSITSLGSHMDYVGNTIAALKLYLDTGLLVGALTPMIDRELYKEWLKQ